MPTSTTVASNPSGTNDNDWNRAWRWDWDSDRHDKDYDRHDRDKDRDHDKYTDKDHDNYRDNDHDKYGDRDHDKYGDRERNAELKRHGLKRTFLHAQSVAFEWPGSGVPFHASAPLPSELAAVLDAITPMKRRAPPRQAAPRRATKRPAHR